LLEHDYRVLHSRVQNLPFARHLTLLLLRKSSLTQRNIESLVEHFEHIKKKSNYDIERRKVCSQAQGASFD